MFGARVPPPPVARAANAEGAAPDGTRARAIAPAPTASRDPRARPASFGRAPRAHLFSVFPRARAIAILDAPPRIPLRR